MGYCANLLYDPLNCGGCFFESGMYFPEFVCQSNQVCVEAMCANYRVIWDCDECTASEACCPVMGLGQICVEGLSCPSD